MQVQESKSRRVVREMTAQGHRPRDIALVLGISTQRVHQHLKAIKQERDEEKAS